jgi:hypothetical protein
MWNLDRRVATAAVVSAGFVLAITIGTSDAPAPVRAADNEPVVLAQELAALANRGARASWLVTFAFTRTPGAGGQLHETLVVAHTPSIEVDDGLGSLVVTANGRTYSCTVVSNKPQCLTRSAAGSASHPGDVYGGAVVSGLYTITRGPAATITGLEARCFFLRLRTGNPVSGIGFSSEQCYSSDGVPLRSRVQSSGALDEREALTVRRTVGRAELLPVLQPYGLARLAPDH